MKIIKLDDIEYPNKLKQIASPPEQLYIQGNEKLLNMPGVAIVGSRVCTDKGAKIAKEFAYNLAKAGLVIVSGMALRNRYCSTYWGIRSTEGKQ